LTGIVEQSTKFKHGYVIMHAWDGERQWHRYIKYFFMETGTIGHSCPATSDENYQKQNITYSPYAVP